MKINFNKILAILLASGIALSFSGCGKNNKEKSVSVVPTTSISDKSTENEAFTENISSSEDNYDDFVVAIVNEDIYNNLVKARDNFCQLFDQGDVSNLLRENGVELSNQECEYINNSINDIYDLIDKYINYFESKDLDSCYMVGQKLNEYYTNSINPDYLFSILVSRNLPEEYRSSIKYDEFNNIYDISKNINLDNGTKIKLLGGEDDIIGYNIGNDLYTDMILRSKWFENLPKLIFNKYEVIEDPNINDEVCYFINVTKALVACDQEYKDLLEDGALVYSFDPDSTQIVNNSDSVTGYTYVNYNNQLCGELDYSQSIRALKRDKIMSAISSGSGEVLVLDSYVSDMYYDYSGSPYSK